MSAVTRILTLAGRLPKPRTKNIGFDADLGAKMPDGVVLLANRHYPIDDPKAPIILVRTPYGRTGLSGIFGEVIAQYGYQVITQSTRGTFGSGGEFVPFLNEAEDGKATLEWLSEQDWFVPQVAMWGPSYVGYTQWSAAVDPPPYLKALVPQVTASTVRGVWYPQNVLGFDSSLSWAVQVHHQEEPGMLRRLITERKRLAKGFATLPVGDADKTMVGQHIEFFQTYLATPEPDAPVWREMDRRAATATFPPAVMIAGWYDIFVEEQLADFVRLQKAGRPVRLVVGPWKHSSPAAFSIGIHESIALFDAELRGRGPRRGGVRVHLMGDKRWVDLPSWPPPTTPTILHLRGGSRLSSQEADDEAPDAYVYDPADPTPAAGGIVLGGHGGPRDQADLEKRADVLTYTTDALGADVTVLGAPVAELHVTSSLFHTDFVARLCDVDVEGKSINICEGIVRVDDTALPTGMAIRVTLTPTGHVFKRGHRIRLQVSSGAHPRWVRNLGTGEPTATATGGQKAHQQIAHQPSRASSLTLPVWSGA